MMEILDKIRERIKRPWQSNATDEEFATLEAQLQETLVAVTPRAEFVDALQQKLTRAAYNPSLPVVAIPEKKARTHILLGTASALSITMLLLSGVRIAATLLGAVGFIYQLNRYFKEKRPAPPFQPTT